MRIRRIKFHLMINGSAGRGLFAAVMLLMAGGDLVRAGEVNTGYFGETAIMGYDPVAYFTMKDAVKGSPDHAYKWLGVTWLFLNEEHRKAFSAKPVKYAPQYGGLCSVGVAYGEVTREIDPEAWSVIDGKLYFNYAKSVTKEFEQDSEAIIARADANWPNVKRRLAGQN